MEPTSKSSAWIVAGRACATYGVRLQPVTHTLAVQICGEVQVPHEATVRLVPQLSFAVTPSQFFPRRVQNVASLSAVHPHTLAAPPPPQVWGVVHVPQSVVRDVPQLSAAVRLPQFLPCRVQNVALLSGVQPHTFVVPPPPQVWGVVHVPHDVTVRLVPQLSFAVTPPQFFPSRVQNVASFSPVQPHTLATDGVAPPQV
jgi:hypothetical protein